MNSFSYTVVALLAIVSLCAAGRVHGAISPPTSVFRFRPWKTVSVDEAQVIDSPPVITPSKTLGIIVFATSTLSTLFFWSLLAQTTIPELPEVDLKQAYGDRMALNNEYSNIWKPQMAIYSFIAALSAATSLATGCHLGTIPAYYAAGLIAFFGWHLAAHWTKGALNDEHMKHHSDDYPPDDFYGDKSMANIKYFGNKTPTLLNLMDPRSSMTTTLAHEGPLVLLNFIILAIGHTVFKSSWGTLASVVGGYSMMALIGSALHVSFHIRNFELEPYAWYRELRMLHYIHHLDRKNFAMVNMVLDKLFRTFRPSHPAHDQIT